MRGFILFSAVVTLLLVASACAERERLPRRLLQVSPSPASPPKATSPTLPKPNIADKLCNPFSGTLYNATKITEKVVTTCTAAEASKAATRNATTKPPTYVGTATRCSVVKGVIKTCAPVNGIAVKSPVLPPRLPSPVPSPSPAPKGKKSSSSVGPAVGGAIGGIAALSLIGALVWVFVIKKRRQGGDSSYASTPKQPFRAKPDVLGAGRDQSDNRPTSFVVGKDPAMLSRRHEDLKQAIQSFEARFQPSAPPAFWQRLVAQAPALEAGVDAGPLGAYLLRHHIWRWFDTKLWADGAPLAKPPVFPRSRSPASYDAALTELKANPETYQQFSAQVARELAEDLRLPREGQATYEKDLQYLAECAVELRLAVGMVDPKAMILVAPVDTQAPSLHLRAADPKSQQVFRSLPVDPRARSRVTPGAALCHVPGIGHYARSYVYEAEQVIATSRA